MLIPLFPLNTVLFPGGTLKLRVFERRYLDMVSNCLRGECEFGVCLIKQGREVGGTALPYDVGTVARIVDWEQRSDGLLGITVQGGSRFVIDRHRVDAHHLLMGEVTLLEEPAAAPLPAEFGDMAALLRRILEQLGGAQPEDARYEDAGWVGCQLAEILPLPLSLKQELLELDDPIERLTALRQGAAKPADKAI